MYLLICLVSLVCYFKSTDCDPAEGTVLADTVNQCCTVATSAFSPRTGSCTTCGSNPGTYT